ncbi:hypothetical protein QQS21_001243 [Conoideocrella luteorostrata]|uniref:Uncharacterized protein n=1 Tax=Conoideocrella luteorostrata TaxID=1105319 RepID=A0AAJ0CXP6_9HYPO|nr:hypothetical protein QQS21_001243 [Conoideocrella luteorostrata]
MAGPGHSAPWRLACLAPGFVIRGHGSAPLALVALIVSRLRGHSSPATSTLHASKTRFREVESFVASPSPGPPPPRPKQYADLYADLIADMFASDDAVRRYVAQLVPQNFRKTIISYLTSWLG